MIKKIINIFIGTTIAALGIAMVLNSDLGAFATTAMNKSFCYWTGLPFWVVNLLVELCMIGYATHKGEGLGWTAVINATYGSVMIGIFHSILPHNSLLFVGVFILPFAWSIMEKAGLGATGSNILMRSLMKTTGEQLTTIRLYEEISQLIIVFLGARQYITWFTIVLSFTTPYIINGVYKITNHKPAMIKHDFIICKHNKI